MNSESKLIFESYKTIVIKEQEEWSNIDDWIKYFSSPTVLNSPVEYKTETQTGASSLGSNVTLNQIITDAKNKLKMLSTSPQSKHNALTQISNSLQDYASGLKQLDTQSINDLMDVFADLNNVERFVLSINTNNQPSAVQNTPPNTTTTLPNTATKDAMMGGTPRVGSLENEEKAFAYFYKELKGIDSEIMKELLETLTKELQTVMIENPTALSKLSLQDPSFPKYVNDLNTMRLRNTYNENDKMAIAKILAKFESSGLGDI